jgi:hypothetical protein
MSRGARTRPSTLVGAWVGNGLVTNLGDFESIATTTVGAGGASSVSFNLTGISSYKHLQIRFFGKSSSSGDVNLTYNSDTGSNYRIHTVRGYGSSVASDSYAVTAIGAFVTGDFAAGVTDILDYSNTSKYKVARTLFGFDENGSGQVGLWSHLWVNTAAITLVTLTPSAGSFSQYSSFALYGIK